MRVRAVGARRAIRVKAWLTNASHCFWNRTPIQPELITNRIERPPKETKSMRERGTNHAKNEQGNDKFDFHVFTLNILSNYINYVK